MPTLLTARFVRAGLTRTATALAAGSLLFGMFVPVATAAGGLEVTTPYPAVSVAPGAKVSFDLTVSSDVAAEVSLKVAGAPTGWTATLHGGGYVVDGVTAGPGKDGTARLDVKVPADAAASTQRLSIEASGAGGAQDVLRISINVDAAAAGDITITTNTPTLTGASNGTFPFAVTLHNDTAQDVTVSATASVTDHPDWEVKAEIAGQTQAASTVVTAGSTTSINVTADPPDDAPAGAYEVHVEVKAGDQTLPGNFGVELTGSYSMTVTTPGQLLSARGSSGGDTVQDFSVTNTGTAALTGVKLTATPPTGWTVKFDPETVESIAAGESAPVRATITPSGDAIAGDYQVSISGASDQANATLALRFTVETSLVWVLVGVGAIVLILLGLFYVFRTYGRR